MVFVENEVDRRGKLYKAVSSAGRAVEMKRQTEKTLMNWVLSALRKEKKNITSATMELFLTCTGSDMEFIQNELEKAAVLHCRARCNYIRGCRANLYGTHRK